MKDEQDVNTQELPLTPELTPPSTGAPPMIGWWLVRRVVHAEDGFQNRRWWNGSDWSYPVEPGTSDKDADNLGQMISDRSPDDFEWCGLTLPYEMYPYRLQCTTEIDALVNFRAEDAFEQAKAIQQLIIDSARTPEPNDRRRSAAFED